MGFPLVSHKLTFNDIAGQPPYLRKMSERQQIQVSNHAAELQSLVANNHEYLWLGNPNYWERRGYVLI